ncbi:DUF1559 family PulG-like putative transporter [Gimesia algae]|uniref:DUF1559 domain-containing protein n=1 Tax=Gimesia algae TaxID=2527971 RepID=A0A517VG28_9PLAN|nr:DUF1559 domain-containing protein [Gimesia algae]QDT91959.1 hypothetical protein Pan161_36230 [Gimesia algae]
MDDKDVNQAPPSGEQSSFLYYTAMTGGILVLGLIILPALLRPVEQSRDAARRSQTKYALKQMGLAFHQYHDSHEMLPAGSIETAEGKPGHSWLTALLPYLDQRNLHQQIDFDKAWNDPANQHPFQQLVSAYLNPNIQEKVSPDGYALSHYQGNELVFQPNQGIRISEIRDGESNTIFAVEAGENFKAWGDPANLTDPSQMFATEKKNPYVGGKHFLFRDGRVQFLSELTDPAVLKALSTPAGGK